MRDFSGDLFLLMAARFPVKLDDYCSYFDVNLFHLSLPCIFCGTYCNLQDLASFYLKDLNLVWRSYRAHACCIKCTLLSARHEYEKHCICVVHASSLELLAQRSLVDIPIRCTLCYKLLDVAEKVDCVAADVCFSLVRSSWRGPCRSCIHR